MIRLIVSDIDGTLTEDGGSRLDPELYEVILKLKSQGIYFAAASGRHSASIEYIFDPIKDKIFYIGDNGAYLGCYGRELFLTRYKQELAMDVIADMKAAGLDVLVDCADCAYTDSRNPEFLQWMLNGYHFRLKELEDLRTLAEPIVKIAGCRMEGLGSRADGFKEKYGTKLKVTLAGEQWLDTLDPGVSQGAAVKLLQESLMIRPEETMVFGDQLNDIEMLNQAYYSFAVANGRPETRAAARFLADSNGNQGPLKILKLLVERK